MAVSKSAAFQSLGFLMGVITSYGNEVSDLTHLHRKQLQQFIEETETDNHLHYVKGGYRYMSDSGFMLGMPRPVVGDRIVWEDHKTDRLIISAVFEVLEHQLVVEYNWIYKIKIGNGSVRGVLK